jgi:hypothetical protein
MKPRADVVELLQAGHTNTEINRRTGADVRVVARIRKAGRFGPATITRRGTRPHPKDAEIRALLHEGLSSNEIARRLVVDRGTVRRIRAKAGVPIPPRQPLSLQEKWQERAQPLGDGHMEWTGERVGASRTPVMRYRGESHTAAGIAFRRRTGRDPIGHVQAECGMAHCIAPDHVEDEPGRTRLRELLRQVRGVGPRKPYCRRGHDQAEHGRYRPNGAPYCQVCRARSRKAGAA